MIKKIKKIIMTFQFNKKNKNKQNKINNKFVN